MTRVSSTTMMVVVLSSNLSIVSYSLFQPMVQLFVVVLIGQRLQGMGRSAVKFSTCAMSSVRRTTLKNFPFFML